MSGLNQLEKVECVAACDGGPDAPSIADGSNVPLDAIGADTSDAYAASDAMQGLADGGDASAGGDANEGGSASAYRAAVLADSPVGYWRLGDPVGTTTCQPEDGLGQTGAVVGGVIFGVPGALKGDANTAAQFDGTTGSIDVGGALTFTGAAPFSWEIWVRPAVLDGSFCPFLSSMTFDNDGNPIDGTYMVSYSVSNQTFGFERYKGTNNDVFALDLGGLQVNVWTYIVGTSDGEGNGIVYMNGASVLSGASSGAVPTYTADTIFGQRFKGDLDEVAIYDHALSAQSVLDHWNAAQ